MTGDTICFSQVSSRRAWSKKLAYFWDVLPSLMSLFLFSIHAGILNSNGLLTTATILFTSSVVSSPARLFKSMSHFLHTSTQTMKHHQYLRLEINNIAPRIPQWPRPTCLLHCADYKLLTGHNVGDSSTHTTDRGQCKHHLLPAIDVGVAHT